ncbi:hypothetical protein [Streptosporangium minutum]|uniref:hypothetical protein n=1 Tax=Streptosporangium minutum TaxID=569862 RepID=UPI001054F62B|nr:hypothetical protein [Streptosporangium minutum]
MSRQAIDQYAAKQGEDAVKTAWREAGKPGKYQALAAIGAFIGPERLERLNEGASTIVCRSQEPDAAT